MSELILGGAIAKTLNNSDQDKKDKILLGELVNPRDPVEVLDDFYRYLFHRSDKRIRTTAQLDEKLKELDDYRKSRQKENKSGQERVNLGNYGLEDAFDFCERARQDAVTIRSPKHHPNKKN